MTGIIVGTASGNKIIQPIYVGTASGNKRVSLIYVGTASGNKLVYSDSITASSSPTSVSGSSTSINVTSGSTTVTVTNGIGPFTYAWSVSTSGGYTISANSPSSATTTFSANIVITPDSTAGTATCLVTDTATGNTATTNAVSISLQRL